MDLHTFLRKLPKTELHLHLEGSVGAATFADLAAKHGVELPPHDRADDLYDYDSLVDFLTIYTLVSHSIRDHDDFHRVTYECLERCAASGARYVELFFSPESHLEIGVRYPTMLDGICAALRDAERDFGLHCRVIPAVNRELGPDRALQFVQMVLDHRRDEIIGIGLDFDEANHPPAPFVEAFRLAAKNGLHLTSHAGEVGPADNVRNSIQVLGCERIDHGYHIVDDDALVRDCAERGIVFTVCPTTTTYTTIWRDLGAADHAIRRMVAGGLTVMINSDDPPMLGTNLANEYVLMAERLGFGLADFKRFVLNGIEGSWLDQSTKRQWGAEWSSEIDALIARLQ